jgi:hypothetical protein
VSAAAPAVATADADEVVLQQPLLLLPTRSSRARNEGLETATEEDEEMDPDYEADGEKPEGPGLRTRRRGLLDGAPNEGNAPKRPRSAEGDEGSKAEDGSDVKKAKEHKKESAMTLKNVRKAKDAITKLITAIRSAAPSVVDAATAEDTIALAQRPELGKPVDWSGWSDEAWASRRAEAYAIWRQNVHKSHFLVKLFECVDLAQYVGLVDLQHVEDKSIGDEKRQRATPILVARRRGGMMGLSSSALLRRSRQTLLKKRRSSSTKCAKLACGGVRA